jgi:hypothetical protein
LTQGQSFGDLYEIRSAPNQIFVNGATVNDVEVITSLTSTNLRAQAPVSGMDLLPAQSSTNTIGTVGTSSGGLASGGGTSGGGYSGGGGFSGGTSGGGGGFSGGGGGY